MRRGGLGQLFLVSAIGLLVATFLTACQLVTIDYVFVASSAGTAAGTNGQIETFAADSQSGALRKGAATSLRAASTRSPWRSPATTPISMSPTRAAIPWFISQSPQRSAEREGHAHAERPAGGPGREFRRHLSVCRLRDHHSHADRVSRSPPAPSARQRRRSLCRFRDSRPTPWFPPA